MVELGSAMIVYSTVLVSILFLLLLLVLVYKRYRSGGTKPILGTGQTQNIDRLSISEQHWITSGTKNPATITVLLDLDARVSLKTIQFGLEEKLVNLSLNSPSCSSLARLISVVKAEKQHLVFARSENFDIANHVKENQEPIRRADIHSIIDKLVSRPLDLSLPLWLCTLIQYEDGLGSALVFQLHHCVADGVSLVRLLMEKLIDQPQLFSLPYKHRPAPTIWSRCIQTLSIPLEAITMIVRETFGPSDGNSLKNEVITGEKVTSMTEPIPLALLKSVRVRSSASYSFCSSITNTASTTTVNDVLMTAIFSALGQVCCSDANRLARVVFPIYLASIPEEVTLANKYALILVKLPLLEPNPTDEKLMSELAHMSRTLTRAKRSNIPLLTAFLERLMVVVPSLCKSSAIDKIVNKATAVMSNLVGPATSISVFGHKVTSIMTFLPNKGNLTTAIFMMSYNGQLRVSVTLDKSVNIEAKYVTDLISARVNQLIDASLKPDNNATHHKGNSRC